MLRIIDGVRIDSSSTPLRGYSLTDCVSFVVMRERGIATAFAFNRHFEQEGFAREPRSG